MSVSNSSSTTNYTSYDAAGRVTASNQTIGGQTYNFTYSYNRQGSLIGETLPDGRSLTTSYDLANRISTLAGTKGGATTNYVTQSQATIARAIC